MNTQQNTVSENNFEQCIKCTVCTVYCPVAAVNPDYPGPKQAGPDGERLRLKRPDFFDAALKYCMNCKRCEVACPSNVRIGDIIQAARIKYGPQRNTSPRNFVLANTDLVGTLATPFAPIVNTAVSLKPVRFMMDKVMGIDHRRIFPKYAHGTFTAWYRKHAAAAQEAFPRQVSYFHGCYVNYNNPQLGKDLIRIMNALGYGVRLLDKEKCCGVALISNGLYKQARRQAKTNLASIRTAVNDRKLDVITTSSTCTFTLRDEYPHLLKLRNEDVRDHIELATRYLYRLLQKNRDQLKFKDTTPLRVAYHTPCHMEKMGWAYYSIELLRMIPGVEVIVLDSQCCGIAGTYGFKKENYHTSQAVGEGLFRQIEASGADLVATDCETCKWQIEMSTSKRCEHPLSILASRLA
ncbi:anaerobic glycerol-3-phosphate dehydrogenase subunit GlpC [Alistipes sp.]|uniref:anaerobic glycerol-3-phosphate dehydrogenase subunit GlpC n=1 Tax=Alistipes sp. TaxID=1872444 RepID=UPI0025B8D7E3|nr:anaerobic glycerol-3-phosphate dehydrogenase subunit GlpC [Alistipes sp.]MCI7140569.1 anaerobic glycerol-3-phosphate dehydrogenase subunit C [Alistipes sp.]MDY5397293.1 anaerobic glycerol-3-phosphate dehydrogenase subunit GlpC [Alistipes sp.]